MVCFNLFCLEAWHVAEALGARTCALHPYLIPYAMPGSLLRRLERTSPDLLAALRDPPHSRSVSLADIELWMWPLLSGPRWGAWRAERLGLPQSAITADALPEATPLLLGMSPTIVDQPAYWPPSARVCGFWPASPGERGGAMLPVQLADFLVSLPAPPVCVTFGSMPSFGHAALQRPDCALRVIRQAVQLAGGAGVLLLAGGSALAAEWEAGAEVASAGTAGGGVRCSRRGGLMAVVGSLPHVPLFARCAAVLHHGGSGTTAAALLAGVPQIIMPFMFDQFQAAERMVWLGVAPQGQLRPHLLAGLLEPPPADEDDERCPPPTDEAAAAARIAALLREAASDPAMREEAQRLARSTGSEGGVAVAVQALKQLWARPRAAPGAPAQTVHRRARELLRRRPPPGQVRHTVRREGVDVPGVARPCQELLLSGAGGAELSVLALALEETLFLYREIFIADLYFRHGIALPCDRHSWIVDVGANIGLFVLRVHQFSSESFRPQVWVSVPRTRAAPCPSLSHHLPVSASSRHLSRRPRRLLYFA